MEIPKIGEARRLLKIADHMVYVTYPAIGEKRLLIKILEYINKALSSLTSSILDNEIAKNAAKKSAGRSGLSLPNLPTLEECYAGYGLKSGQMDAINEVSHLIEMHSESSMEFVKEGSLVIMSDSMELEKLTAERVKAYLKSGFEILENIEKSLNKEKD